MKEVKFVNVHPPYLSGEVAKFEDRIADQLVSNNIAEYVSRPLEPKTAEVSKNLDKPPMDKQVHKSDVKTK
jgi:hypothetical protein